MPKKKSNQITIISVPPPTVKSTGPRTIGQNNSVRQDSGVVANAVARVAENVDLSAFSQQLKKQVADIAYSIGEAVEASPLGFALAEVEVSLAVTAKGTIGIASAETQGSMKLIFRPPAIRTTR